MLKLICQLAPALLGMNLSPYLSLLGEAIGLEGLNLGLRESGCKRKRVSRMNFSCAELLSLSLSLTVFIEFTCIILHFYPLDLIFHTDFPKINIIECKKKRKKRNAPNTRLTHALNYFKALDLPLT